MTMNDNEYECNQNNEYECNENKSNQVKQFIE